MALPYQDDRLVDVALVLDGPAFRFAYARANQLFDERDPAFLAEFYALKPIPKKRAPYGEWRAARRRWGVARARTFRTGRS